MGGDPSLGLGSPPAPQRPHPAHYSWFGSGWNLGRAAGVSLGNPSVPRGLHPSPAFIPAPSLAPLPLVDFPFVDWGSQRIGQDLPGPESRTSLQQPGLKPRS